ncbi:hypothetical protein GCK72_022334 [Caenorhabditis remanei]|uniref:Uncharacterized protein n=1 Tax=Caenorhabditis remanei TaxID=31234 RepID=A0A6A5FTH4_CAERE|nr:hypothetical protein GCK72_022334 [Caenorhabditis remanei]KAF1745887.1 hypothetical protein GCK72_022334 [Caenorhabditis remanei]
MLWLLLALLVVHVESSPNHVLLGSSHAHDSVVVCEIDELQLNMQEHNDSLKNMENLICKEMSENWFWNTSTTCKYSLTYKNPNFCNGTDTQCSTMVTVCDSTKTFKRLFYISMGCIFLVCLVALEEELTKARQKYYKKIGNQNQSGYALENL